MSVNARDVKKEKEATLTPLKVLIADDDPPTRILLRAAISQWGYEAVEAGDGEEAWEILQQPDAPSLLILDWLMPKLDGIDLCLRIKKELSFQHYIILLTRVEGTENIIKGLEAGADEFLSKPFNMAELRSRLSVGARIVRYEQTLAKKNQQLMTHVLFVQELSSLLLNVSTQLNDFLQLKETLEQTQKNLCQLQQIHKLHSDLNHIVDIIKKFQIDKQS